MQATASAQGRVGLRAGSVFVGRVPERAALLAAFADAREGNGRLVLLVGEPGIGKTRTAEEFATQAQAASARVLWGRCSEEDSAPAFWPWVQVIRTYVAACDADILTSVLGVGAADLGALVLDLHTRLPELPVPEGLDASVARFRLFDSVTTFLRHASQRQPLVVVLDDLHRADEASLRLLQFVAGELGAIRLLFVGTYRDTEVGRNRSLSQVLGELTNCQRIRLSGLNEAEVAEVIAVTAGHAAPPAVAAALFDRTEGNPLFVTQLVRLLASEGRLRGVDAGVADTEWLRRIPDAVRDAIRLRLARLTEPCQRVLRVAAVIGRDFELDLLRSVVAAGFKPASTRLAQTIGPHNAELFDVLDEAEAAGFVDRTPSIVGHYRFSHSLICDALQEELASSERVALHRQIGEALEVLRRGSIEPHLSALAHHFYQAIPDGTASKALDYATRAAQRSAALAAYEDAVAHYEQALRALDHCAAESAAVAGAVDELERRCDLLIALGEAQYNAGLRSPSRTTLLKAAALARRFVAPEPLARAALALIGPGEWTADVDTDAVEVLRAALTALGPKDSAQRARVLSRLAGVLYYSIDSERRVSLSREAIAVAQRLEDPDTEALVLGNAHFALLGPDNLEARLAIATRIVELAEAAGSAARAMSGHYWRLLDLLQLGDIAAADIALHHYSRYAAELRQPFDVWRAASARAMRALLAGRFDEGERLAFEAFQVGQRANSPNRMLTFASQLFTLRREQGRLHELEADVKQFVEQYATVPATRGALALLYSELGRAAEARAEFEKLAARDFADVPRDVSWLNALDMAAQVCAFLGDSERAGILYDLLLPHAQQTVVVAYADACHGAVARSLGLLAATLKRWDDAAAHYERAIALNTKLGAPQFVARTQHAHAEMLLRRPSTNAEIDGAKARQLLNHAIAGYQQLGMAHYLERASALRALAERQDEAATIVPGRSRSIFRREGKKWLIGWAGQQAEIKNYSGVRLIALLLQSPHVPIHVVDLIAAADRSGESDSTGAFYARMDTEALETENLTVRRQRTVEPLLDAQARASYARRLDEVTDELKEASECHDVGWVSRLTDEKEALIQQLTGAYRALDPNDVIRKRVWKSIRQLAMPRIHQNLPGLADHLSRSISTGAWCVYEPKPEAEWEL